MKSRPRDSGRNAQVERILRILFDLIRTGAGLTLQELAETYGTTVRTVQRDLLALRAVGISLSGDGSDKQKRWHLDSSGHTRKLGELLNHAHFLAICFAMGSSGPLRANPTAFSALEDLQDKIDKLLQGHGNAQLDAIYKSFHIYDKYAYSRTAPDVLWSLVDAISTRTICVVTYRRPQREPRDKQFEILPLKIFSHQGSAYLMCQMIKHSEIGTLNIQRIRGLKHTSQRGEVPPDFNAEEVERSAFGVHTGAEPMRYVLQFESDIAEYIRERVWHPSQTLDELPNGRLELTFTCGHSFEVTAWVASWRHWVRVIEPQILRDELLELGATLMRHYRDERRPP